MSLIRELADILDEAHKQYSELMFRGVTAGRKQILSGSAPDTLETAGQFLMGDNAVILADGIQSGVLREQFDMIYCDPPFFTRGDKGARIAIQSEKVPDVRAIRLKAYHDKWSEGMEGYLSSLALRLLLMKDTLKETGSIFVHLDWHASHAVKLLMDEIFGEKNFINEIIWTYKSGGSAKHHLSRKHDNILFYSKSPNYKIHIGKEKSYNRGYKPYHFRGVQEFQDEIGWYTLVNQKDVWQIDMVGRSAAERLNYATQKPEALLTKIIELVTDEGDRCADFFCGSGTLAASAAAAGRRFVCADVSGLAIANSLKRPLKNEIPFRLYDCREGHIPEKGPMMEAHLEENRVVIDRFTETEEDLPGNVNRDDVLRLIREDPFALVDYWMVGRFLDDGSFKTVHTVFRDVHGQLSDVLEDVPEECDAAAVVDVFGKMAIVPLQKKVTECRQSDSPAI